MYVQDRSVVYLDDRHLIQQKFKEKLHHLHNLKEEYDLKYIRKWTSI